MINDLDKTLAKLLRSSLPAEWTKQVQITFATPDGQFPPQSVSLPAVDLFLYDIRENLELRSNEVHVERRSDGKATLSRAPVRVDFSYLVTAWASRSISEPWEDEHRLLGEVMRSLLRYRTIPLSVLQGDLASQDRPLPVTSLQPGRMQTLGEFWQVLGGKGKAALNYTVTVAVDMDDAQTSTLVIDKRIDLAAIERTTRPDAPASI